MEERCQSAFMVEHHHDVALVGCGARTVLDGHVGPRTRDNHDGAVSTLQNRLEPGASLRGEDLQLGQTEGRTLQSQK